MIYKALQLVSEQLNGYLKLSFKLNEDIVFLSPIKDDGKTYPSNRVSIMLVGLDKENSAGRGFKSSIISENTVKRTTPVWQINVNLLISVIFQDKQYEESLQFLSAILSFIQKNNMLRAQDQSIAFAIDPVNLSVQELANLWGICGGGYFPSMLCRLRVVTIDEDEILDLSGITKIQELETDLKTNN